MLGYKEIDILLNGVKERRERVRRDLLLRQKSQYIEEATHTSTQETDIFFTTFSIERFIAQHPQVTYKSFTNFTEEEIDYLVELLMKEDIEKHRGKQMRISPKGCLFIALSYFSLYSSMEHLASITSIKIPTLQRIIRKVVSEYFPVFINKFIPKEFNACRKQFENFPDAVGAVDSTTIEFYRPMDRIQMKKSWDAKNHINGIKLQALVNPAGKAIHINIEYPGSVHDKKIFDVSGITEFLSVKRGVRVLHLPILADRGYIGIEKFYEEAIVQQKGDDKSTIQRNNEIAKDRQIVERYFGRLKMSWGILSDGYRGEKRNLQTIVVGLVALTNYLIDQHPLTADDAPDPSEEALSHTEDNEIEEQSVIYPTQDEMYPLTGIINQGFTCHLNAVIQVLATIPQLVNAVLANTNSRCFLTSALKDTFIKIGSSSKEPIDITNVTSILGMHSTQMQDCIDTYEEIISKLALELQADFDIYSLFKSDLQRKDGSSERALTTYIYAATPDVDQAFKQKKRSIAVFIPPPILVINLCRMQESAEYKHYQTKFTFPVNLNLKKVSTGSHSTYELFGIIAYASLHYVAFVKKNDEWFMYNDAIVCKCEKQWIQDLEGGIDEQTKSLWEVSEKKYVARLLFYKSV